MPDPAAPAFRRLTADDLDALPAAPAPWLWDGYLPAGMVTLLTSKAKAGKTTLLSLLLARMGAGGVLAGAAVRPGRATVVSEEPARLWAERRRRLGLGPHVDWFLQPFERRPSAELWERLIDAVAADARELVVFDTLAELLPVGAENSVDGLLSALVPLRRLTDRGSAVLLLHHPRKGGRASEISPRGSGALTGFVDVTLELDTVPGAAAGDRRRRVRSASRLAGPATRTLELSAAGDDYALVAEEAGPDAFAANWPVLRGVFEDADERLTRKRVLARWPDDHDRPTLTTLRRWLDRAVMDGRIEQHGTGRRSSPFRYCLPGFEPLLEELPDLPSLREIMEEELRLRKRRRGKE